MAWIYLMLAGLFEVGFAVALKQSEGLSKLWPSVTFVVLGTASFLLLTKAMSSIPLGTAYATWTGIGAIGTVLVGIIWFGDPASGLRLFFLGMLLCSLVGLKLVS
ncbi:MAG: multidrug efflux SMR transporter [Oceanospirillales bacterium]|uniref:Guanidinium exporter n=1 Tax=Marinobacterium halophilum TaxID=267374 RepID=A0A2P8EST2_9GAMM|nr:multidrug efflux SMR transporter [Marinobacterium halophilum]MBR9829155.1 multidrug efflux SMR transporter [Oceanospirillales bacterium]PSL12530.1 quaternary ammonium compound-resistance protein SugE [Marinobacterium halophilum]